MTDESNRLKPDGRRIGRWRRAFALALVPALLLGAAWSAAAARFTASLDRDSVVVGEPVNLSLSIEGGTPQEVSNLPTIEGLRISPDVSTSYNTSISPAGTVSIQSYFISLTPLRAGEFTIPALRAKVNGEWLTSQPVRLKVATSDPAMPPASFASQPAFLWPVATKKELFVGEPLVVEVRLYVRGEFRQYDNIQIPLSGDGFVFSPLINGQHFQRRVGSSPFSVVPLYFALTPVKAGTLTMGPVSGAVVLMAGDVFFPRAQQVPLTLEAQTFQVSPLPARDVPPEFNGAVGNFTMSVSAGPTNVLVGDPLTVRIRISGTGHLDTLTLPEQSTWHDLKTYPPTTKVEPQSPLNIEGVKTFEQIVIPQNADLKALPPVSFSFFDPARKTYQTLTEPAIPLIVRPGGSTPVPVPAATPANGTPRPVQDIVSIKQRLGAVTSIGPPVVQRGWFLTLHGLPVLALISAVAWRKRNESLANNPRLRRQRQVARIIQQGLAELRTFAAENNSDAFFATLFRLLQEQLGERLDLPASAITEAVIAEQLEPRGVSETTLAGLHELFQTCNLARYAPIQSSQQLEALIPQLETTLGELQALNL